MSIVAVKENAPPLSPQQQAILAKLSELPPFSPVLSQLLKSLSDENFSFRQLGGLIEQDTVLTGNVMRMVNSAAYGRRMEVVAITKAVSILGVNKVRNLVLTLSVANMWRSVKLDHEWSLERFNAHELATGILCDAIAERLEVEFAEGAFLAGLLHDLGKLLIVMAVPEDHLEIEARMAQTGGSRLDAERFVLGTDHAALSAEGLALWKLPEALQQAVRDHHAPVRGELSMVVAMANECANCLGFSVDPMEAPELSDVEVCGPRLARVGLESQAEAIFTEFRTEYEAVRSLN
jgi:HD-like signal output (HDOD) protein